jgi:hypothetical protein
MTPNEIMIGLVPNLGNEYYSISASPSNLEAPVSKSLLWQFNKSPFKWINGKKIEPTDRMNFGSLVHALCLTPKTVEEQFVLSKYDDFRTKEAREWRDAIALEGKTIIKEVDWQRADEIKETVMESNYIMGLGACDYEVAAFGKIGNTLIKGMIDILPHRGDTLVDLKVTSSIGDAKEMQRLCMNFGYHWQAALYLDLVNGLSEQEPRTKFEFLFIEDQYPYEYAIIRLSDDFINLGRSGYMNAVAKWQQAVSTKKFSPIHDGVLELEPPAWA